jgi:predicted site-specific integrase-resolvase
MSAKRKSRQWVGEKVIAEMTGISLGTLRQWRCVGKGPVFYKVEGRILYDVDEIEAYFDLNKRLPSVRENMEKQAWQ